MTTQQEQAYFEHYAGSLYSGKGEMIDLGSWLGSTTISLARGLAKNRHCHPKRKRIHAFDLFQWEEWMNDCVKGTSIQNKYSQGENFLEEFKTRIEPCAELIEIHAGDLQGAEWRQEIELLLIDAMKSWTLANVIVRKFFPHLIPNVSYVIHQDFAHYYTSWIHLIHYRLRNYFRPLYAVPNSCSFVFQYFSQLPAGLLNMEYGPDAFSEEDIEGAFEYSMNLVSDKAAQLRIASAKVMFFVHISDRSRARFELDRYLLSGIPLEGELKIVNDLLETSEF